MSAIVWNFFFLSTNSIIIQVTEISIFLLMKKVLLKKQHQPKTKAFWTKTKQEKQCPQKTAQFRTFGQCANVTFASKLWERLWKFKGNYNLKFARDWGELQKKKYLLRQLRTKLMKQCQEIKKN